MHSLRRALPLLTLTLLAGCSSSPPLNPGHPEASSEKTNSPSPNMPPMIEPAARPRRIFNVDAFFVFNSSTINPTSKAVLDDLVQKLHGRNVKAIVAVGYADSLGSGGANLRISFRRAEAVKAYLIGKGLIGDKIYVEFHGSSAPREPNTIDGKDNPGGRARNRRVEVEAVTME